jgi:RimJ/RimL family protein N-acetyltransferase
MPTPIVAPIVAPHPIETPRLRLRLVTEADLPDLLRIHEVDEVTRYLPYTTWQTLADAEAWYGRVVKRHEEGSAMQFVLADKASDTAVGTCLLFRFEPDNGAAELGYALGRSHWGTGVMREGLNALIGYAVGPLGLRRLAAHVDPRNQASHRLLLRLGFTHEGMLRQRWVMKGEIKDSNVYSLLRHEWPAAEKTVAEPVVTAA